MLPCAYKSIFGIDCPLCGAQRSFYLLVHGDLAASWHMYPPLLPVLLCAMLFAIHLVNKKLVPAGRLKLFSLAVLGIVMISYGVKIFGGV
jgi:hypothetical protein